MVAKVYGGLEGRRDTGHDFLHALNHLLLHHGAEGAHGTHHASVFGYDVHGLQISGVNGGYGDHGRFGRSEEHTSELQSLMRISYAVLWLKKKKQIRTKIVLQYRYKSQTTKP